MATTLKKPPMCVKQGSKKNFLLRFRHKDGTPFDLVGHTIHFGVKGNINDEDFRIRKSSAIATEILVVGPTTDGLARLFIVTTDTIEMDKNGGYVYDVWLDGGSGDEFPASDVAEFTVTGRVVALT